MFREEVAAHLNALAPGLWITTHEETRVVPEIQEAAKLAKAPLFYWSSIRGLATISEKSQDGIVPPDAKLIGALQHMDQTTLPWVLILADPHDQLKAADPTRQLREILMRKTPKTKTIVVVTPKTEIPHELSRHLHPLPFTLPDIDELTHVVSEVAASLNLTRMSKASEQELGEAAASMTLHEAEVAVRMGLQKHKRNFSEAAQMVWDTKSAMWQNTGLLIVRKATESWDDVGGAYDLHNYLDRLLPSFSIDARRANIPTSKGILLVGPPGTGKSLISRVIAKELGWKFLDWDLGRLLGPYVGTSEENTRQLLEITDLHRPCVVRVDEISHQFSGFESSGYTDSGVVSRMISRILTWLEEREDGIFMVASTNEPSKLPPNLARSGRFGSTWFLDLPTQDGIAAILNIHTRKHCSELWTQLEPYMSDLTKTMRDAEFSGSDIEQTVVETAQLAYPNQPTYKLFKEVLLFQVPSSAMMREQITRMREWAKGRARVA